MTGTVRPKYLHNQAEILRRKGWGYRTIGRELGVSATTVRRWLNPDYDQRMKQNNRARKLKYAGKCVDCGARTSYGENKDNPCLRCVPCHRKYYRQQCLENREWTRERIIQAIQRWASEHDGKPPTTTDWLKPQPNYPVFTKVYQDDKNRSLNPFRYWADAIEAAGFPRPVRGRRPTDTVWSHDEARQLRQQGLTDKEISRRLGIATQTLTRHIGKRGRKQPVPLADKHRTREQRIQDLRKALAKEAA